MIRKSVYEGECMLAVMRVFTLNKVVIDGMREKNHAFNIEIVTRTSC
jgi:hypothetical protein